MRAARMQHPLDLIGLITPRETTRPRTPATPAKKRAGMFASECELMSLFSKEAVIDPDRLRRESTLRELGLDAIDVLNFLFAVEDRYGVKVKEREAPLAAPLGQVIAVTLSRINAAA